MRRFPFRAPVAVLVAATFLAVFSPTTSPLHPRYGADAALFRVIGSALADGQKLYLDVWDHKGPAFLLYQWLAQEVLPGRMGLFALQIVLLAGALLCFDAIARRFGGMVLRAAVWVAVLGYAAHAFDGGNLTEEFSLVFLALALMLLTREWGNGTDDSPVQVPSAWTFVVAGAAFAIVVFVRLNNALPIFAAFLAYFVVVLIRKQQFVKPLLLSLAGFFGVVTLFVGGFWLAGSLTEMIDASFLFNFRYASEKADASTYLALFKSSYTKLALLALVACLVGGIAHFKHTRNANYFILSVCLAGATTLAVFASANGYPHYLLTAIPALALGVILLLAPLNGQAQMVALVAIALVAANGMWAASQRALELTERLDDPGFTAATHAILEGVPDEQRGEIYPWYVPSPYYLVADTQPIHRYFTLQEWWGRSDPRVLEESVQFIKDTEPTRILTPAAGPTEPRVIEILEDCYTLANENEMFRLYERK